MWRSPLSDPRLNPPSTTSLAPGWRLGESSFLRNVRNLLEHLNDCARFYLQRGLRLRRFADLSGRCGDEQQLNGRRSLTKRARFRRRRGSWEPSMALDRRKNSSGHKNLAARSIRPAESRKRVATSLRDREDGAVGSHALSSPECRALVFGPVRRLARRPAECTTD